MEHALRGLEFEVILAVKAARRCAEGDLDWTSDIIQHL